LLLICEDRSSGSKKQEKNSRAYEFDLSHWLSSITPCLVLNAFPWWSCKTISSISDRSGQSQRIPPTR
jgi:hypothetical protein